MSIKTEITRLKNAKSNILKALVEKGVTVSNSVLLNEVADLIKLITDKYLTSEMDDETDVYLSIEFDGETTDVTDPAYYLSVKFN